MNANNAAKILVVFYSRSGTTRELALAIAKRCGADCEELSEVSSRRGLFGFIRSVREAVRGVGADIVPPSKDVRNYDLVLFGTPVWASHVSSPMRGYLDYLDKRAVRAKQVAFFCTMGGSGSNAVFSELTKLTGASPLATLALTTRDVNTHRYAERIDAFIGELSKPSSQQSAEDLKLAGAH